MPTFHIQNALTLRLLATLLAVSTPLVAAAQTGAGKVNTGPRERLLPHRAISFGAWQKASSSTPKGPKFNYCVRVGVKNVSNLTFGESVTARIGYYGARPVGVGPSINGAFVLDPSTAGADAPPPLLQWIAVASTTMRKPVPVGITRLLDNELCEFNVPGTGFATRLISVHGSRFNDFADDPEQINFGSEVPTSQDLRALVRSPKFVTGIPRQAMDKPTLPAPKSSADAIPVPSPAAGPTTAPVTLPKSP